MKLRIPSVLIAVALVFAVSTPRSVAAASVLTWVDSLESGTLLGFDNLSGDYNNPAKVPTFPGDSFSYTGPTVSVNTSAAMGVLHNFVQVDITETASTAENGNVTSVVRWDDNLTISAPLLNGQPGTFTLQMVFSGNFSYLTDPGQNFSVTREFGANGTNLGNTGPMLNTNGQLPQTYNGEILTLSVPFTFGTPFPIYALLRIQDSLSSGQISAGQSAQFHAEGDLTWGGIPQVLDQFSQPVASFTTASDSGVNYANAVPEPTAAAFLLGSAIPLLCGRRRTRNPQRA